MIDFETAYSVSREAAPEWVRDLVRTQVAIIVIFTLLCVLVAALVKPSRARPAAPSGTSDLSPQAISNIEQEMFTRRLVGVFYGVHMAEWFCKSGKREEAKDIVRYIANEDGGGKNFPSNVLSEYLNLEEIPTECLPMDIQFNHPNPRASVPKSK